VIHFERLAAPIWDVFPFPIAVSRYDAEPQRRKIVHVNSRFTRLTGYAREEAIGRPATILDGPKTDPTTSADLEATLRRGRTCEALIIHYRKDGSEYLSRMTVAPLTEPDGKARFLIFIEMALSPIAGRHLPSESLSAVGSADLPASNGHSDAPLTPAPRVDGERPDEQIGKRMRDRRKELGLAQHELATALGISHQQLQKYEAGKNRISAARLWHCAEILKTPIGYFFSERLANAAVEGVPARDRLRLALRA
jgi:PAS domain S-box-containing protein